MEQFQIYNGQQQKTERIGTRGIPLKPGDYRMVVTVVIFNDQGELLIQKRAANKIGFPSYWDYAASGQVLAGEEIYQGAERELFEELGIQVKLDQEPIRFTYGFPEGWDHYYVIKKSINLDSLILQKEEVQEARWVNEEEYLSLLQSGVFIPYLFAEIIFRLFEEKNEHYTVSP